MHDTVYVLAASYDDVRDALADRVSVAITRAKSKVNATAGISGDGLAADVRAAEAKAKAR